MWRTWSLSREKAKSVGHDTSLALLTTARRCARGEKTNGIRGKENNHLADLQGDGSHMWRRWLVVTGDNCLRIEWFGVVLSVGLYLGYIGRSTSKFQSVKGGLGGGKKCEFILYIHLKSLLGEHVWAVEVCVKTEFEKLRFFPEFFEHWMNICE